MMEVRLKPTKTLFFNEDNFFGIYGAEVHPDDQGKVKMNKWSNISIKGVAPKLSMNEEYVAIIKEDTGSQYDGSYILESIKQDKPITISEQRSFLETILTPTQVNAIFGKYNEGQDIVGMIEDGSFDYSDIKGIADKTFDKLREKVMNNVEMGEVLAFCGKYGIKYNMIQKLVKEYKNPKIVIDKINQNPYLLTEIKGIGFLKADTIAKAVGYSMTSHHRIESCIKYIIGEENQSGHSWIIRKQLLNRCLELLNIDKIFIEKVLNNGAKGIVEKEDRFTTKGVYDAEKYISMKMTQFKTQSKKIFTTEEIEEFLNAYCEEHEVELEENQRKFFHDWNDNNILLLIGGGGCVDKDTEFFNGKEWKKISEYNHDDYVLQYNNNGTTELVKPLLYHKLPSEKLTFFKNETGSINQCLSDEHNVVYETSKGNLKIQEFKDVKENHKNSSQGFYGKFRTTFKYGGKGLNLSNEEIKIMVAIIADGYFPNKYGNKCIINLKKQRKKDRIKNLLKQAEINYVEKEKNNGYSEYIFEAPLREKEYFSHWYNCSQEQLKIVANEVLNWDGCESSGRKNFYTNSKLSADFIQFTFTATGNRATLGSRDRTEEDGRKNIEYYVTISKSNKVSMKTKEGSPKLKFQDYPTLDGYKYCFTLPSGMWLMRREGRIVVTGNCGKSWVQQILLKLIDRKNLRVSLLAPTGKATKVIQGYTNREASTIHRKIGLFDNDVEASKEINEDVVIVDESSMCDVFVLAKFFQAITNNGAKILFVGDDFQLPSVGVGNFLYDAINSNCVTVSRLKKVFRQKDGGILNVSTDVREGKQFLNSNAEGRIQFGKDCVFHLVDQQYLRDGYIHYYKKVLEKYNADDIVILSPTKKGKLGTAEINKEIQKIINPNSSNKKEKTFGREFTVTFRVGDSVMNTVNTYQMETIDGGTADVFNGDTGKIIDIREDEKVFVIDFDGIKVKMKFDNVLGSLLHSWAMTIHKSQGSQFPVVIVIIDKSMKFQLNANLIYTGFSRAKNYMLVLGQAEAINFGIKKFANMERRSFMQELLNQYNGMEAIDGYKDVDIEEKEESEDYIL